MYVDNLQYIYRIACNIILLGTDGDHHWTRIYVVCSTSLMSSLLSSVGGLSKYFNQDLRLAVLSCDVIGQSKNRRGVAQEFPHYGMVSSVYVRFLYGFPYRFQRAWTVLWSTKHPHLLCGPYWGCAAPKCHFLSPDSLAKGVFLAKIP